MMYKFTRSLIGLIGVLILVGIATIGTPHKGRGAAGTMSSAPTTQTQNVNVVNTPTVNAQQSGTWNVGISGTPVVGLDAANNTVKFDATNNTVKIDTTNPLPVRDVDNAARHPYAFYEAVSFSGNSLVVVSISPLIPANKRLVIEQISVDAFLAPSLNLTPTQKLTVKLDTFTLGESSHYSLTGIDAGQAQDACIPQLGYLEEFIASSQVKMYGDPGDSIQVRVFRNFNGGGSCDHAYINVSGYLVDVP